MTTRDEYGDIMAKVQVVRREAMKTRVKEQLDVPLPCVLSIEAKANIALAAAEGLKRAEDLDTERKAQNDELRQEVTEIREKALEDLDRVRSGRETKPVRCLRVFNFKTGEVTVTRLDLDEAVVPPRELTEQERQGEFPSLDDTGATPEGRGRAAAEAGDVIEDNPYEEGTDEYVAWQAAYEAWFCFACDPYPTGEVMG